MSDRRRRDVIVVLYNLITRRIRRTDPVYINERTVRRVYIIISVSHAIPLLTPLCGSDYYFFGPSADRRVENTIRSILIVVIFKIASCIVHNIYIYIEFDIISPRSSVSDVGQWCNRSADDCSTLGN